MFRLNIIIVQLSFEIYQNYENEKLGRIRLQLTTIDLYGNLLVIMSDDFLHTLQFVNFVLITFII